METMVHHPKMTRNDFFDANEKVYRVSAWKRYYCTLAQCTFSVGRYIVRPPIPKRAQIRWIYLAVMAHSMLENVITRPCIKLDSKAIGDATIYPRCSPSFFKDVIKKLKQY